MQAIHDGVIEAEIDHTKRCLVAKAILDEYSTSAPQEEFHKRIATCMDVHAEAVRSMRYPPGAFRKDQAALTEARQREDDEAALSNVLEEGGGDDDGDDDDGDMDM